MWFKRKQHKHRLYILWANPEMILFGCHNCKGTYGIKRWRAEQMFRGFYQATTFKRGEN